MDNDWENRPGTWGLGGWGIGDAATRLSNRGTRSPVDEVGATLWEGSWTPISGSCHWLSVSLLLVCLVCLVCLACLACLACPACLA